MLPSLLVVALALQGPAPAPQPPADEAPLRGPAIPQRIARTIVSYDARGNFRRVEGRPEAAALAALQLGEDEAAAARQVLTDRSMSVGMLLVERVDWLKEAADAEAGGDRERAPDIARRLWDAFEPARPRSPLLQPLGAALSPAQKAELERLVNEYWEAWTDWELRAARDKGPDARRAAEARLAGELFAREIREAYDRSILPYRQRLEAIYAAIDPTPEQRAAIRDLVVAYIRESRLRPTPEQRLEVLRRIYLLLDEDRRTKLFELVAASVGTG